MIRALLAIILTCVTTCLWCQEEPIMADSTQKRVNTTILPIVYFTPETGLAIGAGASLAFRLRKAEHASSIQVGGLYTLRMQLLTYLSYQLFFKEDRYRLKGEIGYFDYVYEYYGIGNLPREQEFYDANYPRIRLTLTKNVKPHWYAGLDSQWDWFKTANFTPGGNLNKDRPIGYDGGAVGLIGPIVQWDTRDNVYWAQKGHYMESKFLWSQKTWGADFNFRLWLLDIRKYFSLGKQALAFQFYQKTVKGDVPFYQLSHLGGSKLLRGYYEGYLRDNIFMSTQAEFRSPLFWRIGYAVFAGIGTTSSSWSTILKKTYWPSVGAGIRFAIVPKERINLRLDYAFGRGVNAFYLTFAEAF